MFLVDESYAEIGNNYGTVTVQMEIEETPVQDGTWTGVKATYR